MSYAEFFKKSKEAKKSVKPKKTKKPKREHAKKGDLPPLKSILCGIGLSVFVAWFLIRGEKDIWNLIDMVEVSFLTPALAEKEEPKAGEKKDTKGEKGAELETADGQKMKARPRSWTAEEVNLFKKLDAKKSALDMREKELVKLEEELQRQKEGLDKRLAALQKVRDTIAEKLEGKVKLDEEKINNLIGMYQNMKPNQAAKVIENLNDDLAVQVLTKMKNKKAAAILDKMNVEKAQRLSERFAGYKKLANK